MKKWLSYLLLLAAVPVLSFGGFGGQDVGKLQPVQVILVRTKNGQLHLSTDTQSTGLGEDIHKAIADMNETSSSQVFLDTADYLLLTTGTEDWLPQLQEYLRPSCSVCYVSGEVDLTAAGEFLQHHQPKLTLTQYEAGETQRPLLVSEEGRMKLVYE